MSLSRPRVSPVRSTVPESDTVNVAATVIVLALASLFVLLFGQQYMRLSFFATCWVVSFMILLGVFAVATDADQSYDSGHGNLQCVLPLAAAIVVSGARLRPRAPAAHPCLGA